MEGIQKARYDTALRSLHWLMAILLITSITLVEFKGFLPKGHLKHELVYIHIEIGLLVFVMVSARIFWRTMTHVPQITPPPSRLQNALAGLMHTLLYVLMSILPMLGILALQAKGKNVDFFQPRFQPSSMKTTGFPMH
jgi:superoxide oxidase